MSDWLALIPREIRTRYEVFNFNHAAEILSQAYPLEYAELMSALNRFSLSVSDIVAGGGSESAVPKKFSSELHPLGWQEVKITGDLIVKLHQRGASEVTERTIENFIAGHNIDYVKNKVAVDMEWNSKDQTFDRDLYAFRTFYECDVIACGVLITRSESLNKVFRSLNVIKKYGASTTWMGKLLPRIRSGRHGGCPLLVVGITPESIRDWRVRDGE
ncbi:MAG: restriction endonuclease [Oscillospiraceae bacterium]|jgi:hypothetical protein|nr:restriction endonuclease [Oscillospiraceae bacterium]